MWCRQQARQVSRLMLSLACILAVTGATASAALAGSWAVTTLDALPEDGFQAAATYRVGYTIRQHGQTPFVGAKSSIKITSATTREEQVFAGSPDGSPGHYVAEVTFPAAGEWSWEVSQHPFAVQALGSVTVGAPGSGATAFDTMALGGAPVTSFAAMPSWGMDLRWMLLGGTLVTLALFGLRWSGALRRRGAGAELPLA